jgi:hypothetical protein
MGRRLRIRGFRLSRSSSMICGDPFPYTLLSILKDFCHNLRWIFDFINIIMSISGDRREAARPAAVRLGWQRGGDTRHGRLRSPISVTTRRSAVSVTSHSHTHDTTMHNRHIGITRERSAVETDAECNRIAKEVNIGVCPLSDASYPEK